MFGVLLTHTGIKNVRHHSVFPQVHVFHGISGFSTVKRGGFAVQHDIPFDDIYDKTKKFTPSTERISTDQFLIS